MTLNIIGVLALLLFLLMSPSTADIETTVITSDRRSLIHFQKFGFTNQGRVAITASSVSVVAPSLQLNLTWLGFFLTSEELLPSRLGCILDSPDIFRLFTFDDLPPPPVTVGRSYPINISNEYSLIFANCLPESFVTMTVDTELYNLNPDGSRNYLSLGQTQLPWLFFLFAFPYLSLFLGFFLYFRHVSVHYSIDGLSVLMLLLLLSKAILLLFAALDMHYVKVIGTFPYIVIIWSVFSIFVLQPTVYTLVLDEWPFTHRVVGMKLLIIVTMLKFLLPSFVYQCGFVFLIVWSVISSHSTTTQEAAGKPTVSAMTSSMNLLCKFSRVMFLYLVVIAYFVFTPFGISALMTAVSYEHEWVSNLVDETASLLFCVVIMFYVLGLLEKKDQCPVIGEEKEELRVDGIVV